MKRKVSSGREGLDSGVHQRRAKQAKQSTIVFDNVNVDDAVKDIARLLNDKQTRLTGLTKFHDILQNDVTSKQDVISKYLQTHSECTQLFKALDERVEERSLVEVQLVIQILETILLHLTENNASSQNKSTVIVSRILTNYRKLVYNLLNPSSPAKVVAATVKLLTAIVMQGSTVAKELLGTFDFSHKTFRLLVNRRDKKDTSNVRHCFIKFVLAFFINGDPSLIQQLVNIKGFATSIFKNLHTDPSEIIQLVLSTLLVQIAESSVILKKVKILLFTSYSLLQLVNLYKYEDEDATNDISIRSQVHNILLKLCASETGIVFENKLGLMSSKSNNPVLLRFLTSLPKTLEDELLVELVIKTLVYTQDLITPYLRGRQMALKPRSSEQWSKNILFLIKLYRALPKPSVLLAKQTVPSEKDISKLTSLISPVVVSRTVLTKGLLHTEFQVRTLSFDMVILVLKRAANMVKSLDVPETILKMVDGMIETAVPSLQEVITVREQLMKTINDQKSSDMVITFENAEVLLSQTLTTMHYYQYLWPDGFTNIGYNVWNILPKNELEFKIHSSSAQRVMLSMILESSSSQWLIQEKSELMSKNLKQILMVYLKSNDDIQMLAKEIIAQLFLKTGVFGFHKDEVHTWLSNLLDDCLEEDETVVKFVENVYICLVKDACDLVDIVLDCNDNLNNTTMSFSPLIVAALKVFCDDHTKTGNTTFVSRFLGLNILDLLIKLPDPETLYIILNKYLPKTDTIPLQTKTITCFVRQCCQLINDEHNYEEIYSDKVVFKQLNRQLYDLSAKTQYLVNFLKCNPLLLFDSPISDKVDGILSTLPPELLLRQLLMFLMRNWNTENELIRRTEFKKLVTALEQTVKQDKVENPSKVVTSCMFVLHYCVQLYLKSHRNVECLSNVAKVIVESLLNVLRTLTPSNIDEQKVFETSSNDSLSTRMADLTGKADLVVDTGEHAAHTEYEDDASYFPQASTLNKNDLFLDCLHVIFNHAVFKHHFCENNEVISPVITTCVVKVINEFKKDLSPYSHLEIWQPYITGISHALKTGTAYYAGAIAPFDVHVTSLVEVFGRYIPVESLKELVMDFQKLETNDMIVIPMNGVNGERKLTEQGKPVVILLDCFLSRGMNSIDVCTVGEMGQVFDLLFRLDCQEADELVAKYIFNVIDVLDHTKHAVLTRCFERPSLVRVETLIVLLCSNPSSVEYFERYLSLRRKESKKKNGKDSTFDAQWEFYVPLLVFYLSNVEKDDASSFSKTKQKCLKYICDVSWKKLWLLLSDGSKTCSEQHCHLTKLLLKCGDFEIDSVAVLFEESVKLQYTAHWNSFALKIIEILMEFISDYWSDEKTRHRFTTAFVFVFMKKVTTLKKTGQNLRSAMLHILSIYGKETMRVKPNEYFTTEEFVNETNKFIKTALRSHFSCANTLNVLGVLVKNAYQCSFKNCSASLLTLVELYQFILSHSKFLDMFMADHEDTEGEKTEAKGALVDLLQTIVDLNPECCDQRHVSMILAAYSATMHSNDQKMLRLFYTYESVVGELTVGSQMLWGEAALEAYKTSKEDASKLWHQPNIAQVLELLDSKLLLQSGKHFPTTKSLQPTLFAARDSSHFYDPSFLLPLFSFFMGPDHQVDCKRFVDRCGLAYTIFALTSSDELMRKVAYQILTRFLVHLSSSRFREKQQVAHLLHCFQNGITQPNSRITTLVAAFIARALHIFVYPEDPLYVSVNSYTLQKPFMDLHDVPLFLSLINSVDLEYRTERIWLLHLLLDGLRDPMDYYACKKYHVFQQLFSLHDYAVSDKHLQNLVIRVIQQVSKLAAPVYDLCCNYGLVPWLHMIIRDESLLPEVFSSVINIVTSIWFTLIGQRSTRGTTTENTTSKYSLPKNIASQLLLLCSSVLQKEFGCHMWNEDLFRCFLELLVSLLEHDVPTIQPHIANIITTQQLVETFILWKTIFKHVNVIEELPSVIKMSEIPSSKWFNCLLFITKMLKLLPSLTNNGGLKTSELVCIPKPTWRYVQNYIKTVLSSKLRPLLESGVTVEHIEGLSVLEMFDRTR